MGCSRRRRCHSRAQGLSRRARLRRGKPLRRASFAGRHPVRGKTRTCDSQQAAAIIRAGMKSQTRGEGHGLESFVALATLSISVSTRHSPSRSSLVESFSERSAKSSSDTSPAGRFTSSQRCVAKVSGTAGAAAEASRPKSAPIDHCRHLQKVRRTRRRSWWRGGSFLVVKSLWSPLSLATFLPGTSPPVGPAELLVQRVFAEGAALRSFL